MRKKSLNRSVLSVLLFPSSPTRFLPPVTPEANNPPTPTHRPHSFRRALPGPSNLTAPSPTLLLVDLDLTNQNQSRSEGQTVDEGQKHAVHFSTSSNSTHSNYGPPPLSPRKAAHNKLRKAKPDGYESDGGYVSDATRKKTKKKSKKKDKDGAVTNDEESDGGYLSEASTKRKLSFFSRKKAKKSKDEERFPVPIPPVPHLTLQHPIADRFGGRSSTPNSFISSNRSSWTDVGTSRSATPIPPPALPPFQSREDTIQALTHAFNEDAQSIAGSVDWSNTYSHFPRVIRAPQPPLPGSNQERPYSPQPSPRPSLAPTISPAHVRPLKTRPSPLSLSPLSSEYKHASEHSPVPSEMVMVSPDPTSSMPSTGTTRNKLLIAANTTPTPLLPTHASPGPSPIEPAPSFDFIVPIPSPGGSIRSRQFEIPPPSPAPRGPLPQVPQISLINDQSPLLKKPSALLPSGLTMGRLSPGLPPARTPSPVIRGREQPFPVNPVIRIQEDMDTGEPYYPQKLNSPGWSTPRRPPPLSPSSAPPVVSPRSSIGASSHASSNMESEIEAIEALYHDRGGQPNEISHHADVDSVISASGGQQTARESGYYGEELRRSNDEGFENSRLSKPIRIPLDEDDYVSPTGGYLDMDSDLEDDYSKEDGRYSMWGRQSFMDENKSGETRNRFVRNVEATYRKDGRESLSMIGGSRPPVSALSPRKPTAFI